MNKFTEIFIEEDMTLNVDPKNKTITNINQQSSNPADRAKKFRDQMTRQKTTDQQTIGVSDGMDPEELSDDDINEILDNAKASNPDANKPNTNSNITKIDKGPTGNLSVNLKPKN